MKKLLLLMMVAILTACRPQTPAQRPYQATPTGEGALLYVSPNGSDRGTGSEQEPLATLEEALKRATPGSVVRLLPGLWHTRVEIHQQASRETPLTIEGARGPDGSWLSILDGSTAVTPSDWKARPDLGPHVYSLPVREVGAMLVDGKSVAHLHKEAGSQKGETERPYRAAEVLQWPEGHTIRWRDFDIPFWNTIGGVYTEAVTPQETVLRLAGGRNPAEHDVALGSSGPVVRMTGSFLTLKDVAIQGGEYGVEITGENAVGNTVEGCFIRHGRRRVLVGEGAQETRVAGNRIENSFIGHLTGAWGESNLEGGHRLAEAEHAEAGKKGFVYYYFKYWASGTSISDDVSIQTAKGSRDTVVINNRLKGGLVGIGIYDGSSRVKVIGNEIRHFSSVGTVVRNGVDTILYDGNFFYDCNLNLRLHQMNMAEAPREICYVRNVSMQPEGMGTHIFHHFLAPEHSGYARDYPVHKILFAHNTFLGGAKVMSVPTEAAEGKGFPGYTFVNNRFIGCEAVFWARESFINRSGMLGGFDYNQIAGGVVNRHGRPVWQGEHCLESPTIPEGWAWNETDVTQPRDDAGRHAGIDLSRPYQIGDHRYPAVPTFEPGYFTGPKPDLGAPSLNDSSSYAHLHPAR
ncbi:MAG TPA: hypothetical protein VNQ90_16465 [Chthoniobacteraceae bacterium]|nr:hypothetical protein [Chthoniobacteraceae bacterium]